MGIEESSLFEEIERMGWAEAALPRLPRCTRQRVEGKK
jgi:hypothetical protein